MLREVGQEHLISQLVAQFVGRSRAVFCSLLCLRLSRCPENSCIAHAATVSLLDCALLPDPPAYLTHVGTHLRGIAYAPGVTTQQQSRAIQINSDLNNVKAWLLQVHSDALKLVAMNNTQLMQAQNMRDDMATQAGYVIGGHVDPTTQTLEPGVGEICVSITLLASFEVKAYKA